MPSHASAPRLEDSIRLHLAPHLLEDGFTGSGRVFRRVIGEWIQVLSVQGSRYGGQFAINLGLQPLAVPDVLGKTPNPKKITESLCEFRRRLSESGEDQWWDHGPTVGGMNAAVIAAAKVYVRIARPLFDLMAGPDSPPDSLRPEDMPSYRQHLHGFGYTVVRVALVLAKLRHLQGRHAEARAFAAYGLEQAGEGMASSLRRELEGLTK